MSDKDYLAICALVASVVLALIIRAVMRWIAQ